MKYSGWSADELIEDLEKAEAENRELAACIEALTVAGDGLAREHRFTYNDGDVRCLACSRIIESRVVTPSDHNPDCRVAAWEKAKKREP